MSFGMRCKYCGWFENFHHNKSEVDDKDRKMVHYYYDQSLETCPGFEYKSEDLKEIIILPDN